jgi:hypothetical protein
MADGAPDPSPEQVDEMAQLVRPRLLLTAVEFMQTHGDPISERLWENVYRIAIGAKHPRTRLIATRMFVDRSDPLPRPPAVQVETGPVTITWKSNSTTALDPSRPSFMTPLPPTGPGPSRSSATDALEKL